MNHLHEHEARALRDVRRRALVVCRALERGVRAALDGAHPVPELLLGIGKHHTEREHCQVRRCALVRPFAIGLIGRRHGLVGVGVVGRPRPGFGGARVFPFGRARVVIHKEDLLAVLIKPLLPSRRKL